MKKIENNVKGTEEIHFYQDDGSKKTQVAQKIK